MEDIIVTKDLTKEYRGYKAHHAISMCVKKGSIYGLIGRNGAGKTTFMRMLLGLSKPTKGEIQLFGKKGKEMNQERSRIGSIIETPAFITRLSAYDNLMLRADLLGLKDKKKAIHEALKKVGLYEKRGQKVKGFSLGMRQSLGIACAILGEPELLILDEPINGLDPIAIANVRKILLDLNKKGTTIIISSHILGEMEKVATCYGFIVEGKLVKEISEEEVKNNKVDLEKFFIKIAGGELDA